MKDLKLVRGFVAQRRALGRAALKIQRRNYIARTGTAMGLSTRAKGKI